MKRALGIGLLVVVCLGAMQAEPKSIFDGLKVGQPVTIKDCGQTYEIAVFEPNVPTGHKIVDVARGFLVIEDINGVRQVRIPVQSIKAVIVNRMPKG